MRVRVLIPLLVILIVMLFPIVSIAQTPPPDDPIDTPIDGGLSILVAAGVGYGVKKIRDNRKKNGVDTTDDIVK